MRKISYKSPSSLACIHHLHSSEASSHSPTPPLPSQPYERSANNHSLLDHYSAPRNVGKMDKNAQDVGTGLVGAPACGDVMKLQIQVDPATNTISDVKFKTFGCGSAIASSSYLTELVRGMTLEDAGKVRNTEIARELCLPPVKCTFTACNEETTGRLRIGKLIWGYSALLYAGRRCDQISHLELLLQKPQGQSYRPWGYGGCDAEDRG